MVKFLVFIGVFSTSMVTFGVTHLKGEVLIDSKKVSLTATYRTLDKDSYIKLGNKQYSVSGYGSSQIEGIRTLKENNKILADENIIVQLNPDAQAKQELNQIVPGSKCKDSDNILVLIGDNLKGTVSGGCGVTKN